MVCGCQTTEFPLKTTPESTKLADILTLSVGTYGFSTPKRVWVIGYEGVWVMLTKPPPTNSGVTKRYGLLGSMGTRVMGYEGCDCIMLHFPN